MSSKVTWLRTECNETAIITREINLISRMLSKYSTISEFKNLVDYRDSLHLKEARHAKSDYQPQKLFNKMFNIFLSSNSEKHDKNYFQSNCLSVN